MTKPVFSDDRPSDGSAEYRQSTKSRGRLLVLLIFGVFTILLVWAWRPAPQEEQGATHPQAGKQLTYLEVEPLVGVDEPLQLEDLEGSVVLINFWGTWCPPCLMEFPKLIELHRRWESHPGFRFLPIVCGPGGQDDVEELKSSTEAYLDRLQVDLPVYSDPRAVTRVKLMEAAGLGTFNYPTTILLDQTGGIQAIWEGYRPGVEEDMEALLEKLLKS